MATLAPSTIPRTGRVTLTGRITNRSDQTWTDLNVYLLTSPTPITTRSDLAEASKTDPTAPVGSRQTDEGLYDKVGDLSPGESVPYRLSVQRRDLGISGEPGVYWVGVHVLGAQDGARDTVADGRARTFMPLLPQPGTAAARQARTRLSLVVPIREPVHRGGQGRLLDLPAWNRTLAPGGRLDRLLRLTGRTRASITWVVDPAVLDAVASVARDNPALNRGPSGEERSGGAGTSPSAIPSDQPSTSPSASPSSGATGDGSTSRRASTSAVRARRWLGEFRRQARRHAVTALPYGDLDLASVLTRSNASGLQSLYARATDASRASLAGLGVEGARPVVDPSSGYLPGAALARVPDDVPVVLRQSALPLADGPVESADRQAPVVLTDEAAGSGGPQPGSPYAALATRQRLLSDAALHALSSARDQPLVVSMPTRWDPGPRWRRSAFFSGLTQPWLRLVDLLAVVGSTPTGRSPATAPVYPRDDLLAQVPVSNLLASRQLARTGGIYARMLRANDTVDDDLARVALLGSSTQARDDPDTARGETTATDDYVRSQLARVRVEGPRFVMMSGESGPIQITLVNGLAQSVRVGLEISTPDARLRVAPVQPVTLGPGGRTTVPLEATSHDIGVHPLTLIVTDPQGTPLGSETQFNVRTSNVSTVIWVIMAIGGGLLFLAIVVRLVRRVRRRKSTHGPLLPRPVPGPVAGPVASEGTPAAPGQELNA